MKVFHKHLIIRANVSKPLVSVEATKDWLCRLVSSIGMKICKSGGPHVDYIEAEGNCGIAGVAMIETSHISCHFWDQIEPPLAQIDIYSCAEYSIDSVFSALNEFEPIKVDYILINRENNIIVEQLGHF
jgi:S-adenosylmethionine/arginine decarboxylase-like enzyme